MDDKKQHDNREKDAEDKTKTELRVAGEAVRDAAVKRAREDGDCKDGERCLASE